MKAVIRLEVFSPSQHKPWVARVVPDSVWGHKREYMRYKTDFSKANSVGSRGIFRYYPLDDGIYEVFRQSSWKKVEQFFILAINGGWEKIPESEVREWLKSASSE